jgi:hypothetical protein
MRLQFVASSTLAIAFIVWSFDARPSYAEEEDRSPTAAADKRAGAGVVAGATKTDATKASKTSKDSQLTVYVPPSRGSVRRRTGGGTRGLASAPRIAVLVPDHVGLTTRAQPTLAWFLSKDTDAQVEVSLISDGATESSALIRLPRMLSAGIHLVDLAEWKASLEEGTTYAWHVALVIDPKARGSDVVASGAIQLQAATPELVHELAGGEPSYRVLARHGIWYDAIADLSAAIAAVPASTPAAGRELRAERAALLEQVGGAAAAAYDRDRDRVLERAE